MGVFALTATQFAPAQRAVQWSRIINDTYFPLHLTLRNPETFSGQLERRQLGQVSLSRLATDPLQFERRPAHLVHVEQEEYLVTVPKLSAVRFHQLGREIQCGPGGFILQRGDEPYRFSYEARNELCVLKVSRRALSEKLRNPDRFCGKVFDARAGLGALLSSMMVQLQSLAVGQEHAADVLGRQIVEILAIALDQRAEHDETRTPVRASHLRRAEQVARRNLSNPALSPEFLANACGISKRYLHELFGDTDLTVSQFIREERLIAARDEITSSRSLPMAEIAYRFGFSDQPQFSRLFKSRFGITPSDWRKNPVQPSVPSEVSPNS